MGGYRQWAYPKIYGQPKSKTPKNQFLRWNLIIQKWTKAISENRDTIVMMDDNIDTNVNSNHSKDYRIKDLYNLLLTHINTHNITIHNSQFTRYMIKNAPSIIDHIFSKGLRRLEQRWKILDEIMF